MLRLHPTIATTVLNLLQKTMEDNTDINTMFASLAWEYLEKTYSKPGITATYKELKATMDVIIPGNADPTLAIDTILIGFTRMAASKCAVPPHLQAMILVSKLPYQMSALVQSICQTDDIEDLKTNDIKRKAILAWEQCSPTQNQNNRPQQSQAARKISAVQRSGPPPSFQQQQQQPQQEEQQQGNQNPQRGGWRGGRGGRGGTFSGTRAGKNKQQNQQQQAARPIEERAPSPAPSFVFGEIASPVVVPDIPRLVYPNFTNALSLAHLIGAKPTIEMVKRLEVIERAKEEQRSLSQPNKRPRCHDFRRFPTFLCLSPKRPHSFTQSMTCFPFPFPHNPYLIFLPHLLSYLLIRSFWIPRTSQVYSVYLVTRILRSTEGVLPTGKSPALQTPLCTCG